MFRKKKGFSLQDDFEGDDARRGWHLSDKAGSKRRGNTGPDADAGSFGRGTHHAIVPTPSAAVVANQMTEALGHVRSSLNHRRGQPQESSERRTAAFRKPVASDAASAMDVVHYSNGIGTVSSSQPQHGKTAVSEHDALPGMGTIEPVLYDSRRREAAIPQYRPSSAMDAAAGGPPRGLPVRDFARPWVSNSNEDLDYKKLRQLHRDGVGADATGPITSLHGPSIHVRSDLSAISERSSSGATRGGALAGVDFDSIDVPVAAPPRRHGHHHYTDDASNSAWTESRSISAATAMSHSPFSRGKGEDGPRVTNPITSEALDQPLKEIKEDHRRMRQRLGLVKPK